MRQRKVLKEFIPGELSDTSEGLLYYRVRHKQHNIAYQFLITFYLEWNFTFLIFALVIFWLILSTHLLDWHMHAYFIACQPRCEMKQGFLN